MNVIHKLPCVSLTIELIWVDNNSFSRLSMNMLETINLLIIYNLAIKLLCKIHCNYKKILANRTLKNCELNQYFLMK